MRYSAIEIPSNDATRAYFNDPELKVRLGILRQAKGSLKRFIADHSKAAEDDKEPKLYAYKGSTEQGVERFEFTLFAQRQQSVKMDELLFIPETHPLFNCYVIATINVKLFLSIHGSLPGMSYREFQTAMRDSVNASNK